MAVQPSDRVQGELTRPIITITATTTLDPGNVGAVINASTALGNVTLTLPSVAPRKGLGFLFRHSVASNTLTIDGSGAETIDGAATKASTTQYDILEIVSDGTEWVRTCVTGTWT